MTNPRADCIFYRKILLVGLPTLTCIPFGYRLEQVEEFEIFVAHGQIFGRTEPASDQSINVRWVYKFTCRYKPSITISDIRSLSIGSLWIYLMVDAKSKIGVFFGISKILTTLAPVLCSFNLSSNTFGLWMDNLSMSFRMVVSPGHSDKGML